MTRVIGCLVTQHDLRLVALAIVVCLLGSAATVQLFGRIRAAGGMTRTGWVILSAVVTGTMVWCTHFVAMMAFELHTPVRLDPSLTLGSLTIAIVVAAPGLALAAHPRRWFALLGGTIVGLAIASMHYAGMAAYRVDGIVEWSVPYVIASVLLSCSLCALAWNAMRSRRVRRQVAGGLLLALAVAALHFTGMAAMRVTLLALSQKGGLSLAAQSALALTTAGAALLCVGSAAVSALIDGHTQSEAYRRLRRMALHDGLTDLPNRVSYMEDINERLRRGTARRTAVVMLDLSRFKSVNDTHGHHAGDQLLVALAARMRRVLRDGECIARLGGDEFAALLTHTEGHQLDDFIARLRSAFAQPFVFERFNALIGANIGVAVAPDDGRDADTLLARADLAMYRAKSAHSGEPCFYDAGMDDSVRERRELAHDLRAAVTAGSFTLHYQVQASLQTGEICGYEALVRWHHPQRGMIPPSCFIPLAEEIGEIVPLSNWILRQACREAARQPDRRKVSVNLSPLHLSDPCLVETVRAALRESGLPASRLTLELTESAIIRDRRYAIAQLTALKALGISLALDDFGVGYSSLDVLRSFAFDRIKLDASFVAEIEHSAQAVAILRSVTALGNSLGIPVLAEGIEKPAQMRIAAREGCSAMQGYLIGRPSPGFADGDDIRAAIAGPLVVPELIAMVA